MAFAKLIVDLALKDEQFKSGLKSAGVGIKGLEKGAGRLDKMIGRTLVNSLKVATTAVLAFGAASAKIGSDFEHSITLVKSLSKDGVENFQALSDEARRLGATTEFSARQAADAMINFARAGMKSNQIISATGPALMLAGGAGESMALATQTLAGTLRQFSLNAAHSGHIADTFTVALKQSLFNLQGLNDAMKYAGPIGAAFDMSMEDTVAAVAQFRNMGLDATMAGTAFRMTMIQLSKATPKAAKALSNYGLTVEDVNPEVHSFRDIMVKLGEAGLTAGDAIAIFGARAAGQVRVLSRQMSKGAFVKEFDDLTESLKRSSEGAGAAAIQYETMGETVRRQFLIAKSAMEELFLKVYDTYKKPLFDFFAELGELIQFIGGAFQESARRMKQGWSAALQDATKWLKANRNEIAVWFISTTKAVGAVVGKLGTLLTILKQVAKWMALVFAATIINAARIGLMALIAQLRLMKLSLVSLAAQIRAVGMAVKTTLGPLGLILIAITAILELWYLVTGSTGEAEDAVKSYGKTSKLIAAQNEKRTDKELATAKEILAKQKANKTAMMSWMATVGKTEKEIAAYANQVEYMTEKEALAQVQTGGMIAVMSGAAVGFHEVSAAAEMFGEKGLSQLEATVQKGQEQVERTSASYERFTKAVEEHDAAQGKSGKKMSAGSTQLLKMFGGIGRVRTALARYTNDLRIQEGVLDADISALKAFRLALAEVGIELDKPPAGRRGGGGGKSKKEYLEELADFEMGIRTELAMFNATEDEKDLQALKEKQTEIRKEFGELIEKKRFRREKEALKIRMEAALASAAELTQKKVDHRQEQFAQKTHHATLKAEFDSHQAAMRAEGDVLLDNRMTHVQKVEMQMLDSLDAMKRGKVKMTERELSAFEAKYRDLRTAAVEADLQARMAFEKRTVLTSQERILRRKRANQEEYDKRLDQLFLQHAVNKNEITLKKGSDVQAELMMAEFDHHERKLALAQEFTEKNARVEVALAKWKLLKIRDMAEEILSGEKAEKTEANKTLLMKVTGMTQEQIDAWEKKLKVAAAFVGAVFVGPTKKAIGLFKEITGFDWDMGSMMDAAAGKKGEMGEAAVGKEAARREAAGEEGMTAEEEAAARAGGEAGYDPAKAAAEAAEERTQEIMDQIQMWIDMAPVLMQKLADNLPVIIDGFVAALPKLIKGLTAAMSGPDGIIMAVVNGIPDILMAFVEQLPALLQMVVFGLIQFLKKGIPQIFDAIMTALPILLMAVAEAIPKIFDAIFVMLPKLIESFFLMIPDLLAALVTLLVNLFGQLVALLPRLLAVLIGMIGPFFIALSAAVPAILEAVIDLIPELIMSLVSAIPEIFFAIIKSIPMIFMAVVGMIPQLVMSLVRALPKLFTELTKKLPKMLSKAFTGGFKRAWAAIKKTIGDFFARLNPFSSKGKGKWKDSKLNPKNWFSDTPGALRVRRNSGTMLGFAPGDYVAAAQRPIDMLAQAMEAVRSEGGGLPSMGVNRSRQAAMMASPVPLAAAMPSGGGGGSMTEIALKVQVEGQTIDNALITSKGRGTSPKIWKEIRRMSGVTSGIDRK